MRDLFVVASLTAATATAQSEWITLIDGTEGIENFNLIGDANWTAEMASIRATQGSGASWLVSKQSYENFEIRVEFWASRCQQWNLSSLSKPERITDRDCYEANIFDQRPEAAYGTGGIVHVASF